MKKVLVICCALLMVMSMGAVAFAAPGSFVSSPTGNQAPTVVEFDKPEDCTAELVITPYGERADLPETLQNVIEKAYAEIRGTDDLTTLNAALAKLAESLKIAGTDLAVSDLFDIHMTGCDYHEEHKDFDIVLSSDMLHNFVGLLHMKGDGQWELIDNAKVVNGEHLVFSVEGFSPFAIVVEEEGAAQTGENNRTWLYVAIMAASATAMLIVWRMSKKQQTA